MIGGTCIRTQFELPKMKRNNLFNTIFPMKGCGFHMIVMFITEEINMLEICK